MFETPAISRRQIAVKIAPGLHVRFRSCNLSATKIASSCCDKNRLCKRAFMLGFPALYTSDTPGEFTCSSLSQRFAVLFWLFSNVRLVGIYTWQFPSTNTSGLWIFGEVQLKEAACSKFTSCCRFLMGVELKNTDTAIECFTVRFFVGTVWLVLHEKKNLNLWTKHYFSDWRVK